MRLISSTSLTNGRLAGCAKYALLLLAGASLFVVQCHAGLHAEWRLERASALQAGQQPAAQQAPAPQAPSQAPLTQKVGALKSISGNALILTADSGTDVSVTVASNAKIVQVAPGEKDLKSATPIALTDLQVGDRVLVRGRASDDAKTMTAVGIIAMKSKDLEAKKAQDRDDWQKRGIGGLVSAVDPATGTITISTGSGATAKTVAIRTTKNTVLRRYAPDSVQFDDAKPAPLDQIKPGDQVRARGTKSEDGGEFAADEIVSGTFRNLAGIITAIDASAQTITLTDLISKKPVVVKITTQSQLRKIPAQMAQMIAFRLKGAGAGAASAGGAAPAAGTASWRAAFGRCGRWSGRGGERRTGRRWRPGRLPTNCESAACQHVGGFSERRRRYGGVHAGHRCGRRNGHHYAGRRGSNIGSSACRQRIASDDAFAVEPRRRCTRRRRLRRKSINHNQLTDS